MKLMSKLMPYIVDAHHVILNNNGICNKKYLRIYWYAVLVGFCFINGSSFFTHRVLIA